MPMDLLSKAAMSIRSSLTKEFCFWHIPEMPPAAIDGRFAYCAPSDSGKAPNIMLKSSTDRH